MKCFIYLLVHLYSSTLFLCSNLYIAHSIYLLLFTYCPSYILLYLLVALLFVCGFRLNGFYTLFLDTMWLVSLGG